MSSHLLSELELGADDLVLLARGEVVGAAALRATVGQAVTMGAAAALAAAVGMVVVRTGLGVAVTIIWVQAVEPLMQLVPHGGRYVRDWLPFLNSMMFTHPQQFQQSPPAGLSPVATSCSSSSSPWL